LEEEKMVNREQEGVSRRHFLKGLGVGVVGLNISDPVSAAARLLSSQEMEEGRTVRRMGGNENPIGPSPKAIEAVAAQLSGLNWYPYQPDLELAIHRFHGIDVPTSERIAWAGLKTTIIENGHVVTGIGSTEVLRAAAWAYLLGGGHVIQGQPSYTEISDSARKLGDQVTVSSINLKPDLTYDLDAMKMAIRPDTRIITLCNPNNPTGHLLSHDELGSFIDAIDPRILIVIDEAYIHFVEDPSYQDAMEFAKTRPNVLVTRTFSKGYGIAGLRAGYGVAHPDVIKKIRAYTLGPLGMHSNSITGAVAALDDQDHLGRTRRAVVEGRAYLVRAFENMKMKPVAGQGNFVLVDTGRDSQEVFEDLLRRDILITPGSRWSLPTFIRVSVGLPEDNEAIVAALRA
jgi:histidinol-phosphate aminotransferase